MKHHHCLLLSLFDRPLALNSSTNHYDIRLKEKSKTKSERLSGLFYDSKKNNCRVVIVKGKVRKIRFDELNLDSLVESRTHNDEDERPSFAEITDDSLAESRTDNNEYKYLSFAEITEDFVNFQLEKGSMFWKFKMEELEIKFLINYSHFNYGNHKS